MSRDLLRERARSGIREAIASGELRPGDQIVEATMAAKIGVSRSPVREALRELEQHGLLVSIPNRGTFVAEMTPEDVEEIIQLRGALEGLAARLAADRMGRRDQRALEDIVERMERLSLISRPSVEELSAFVEADGEFHSALVRFSGHRRVHRLWNELDPFIWLLSVSLFHQRNEWQALDRPAIAREHRELLDMLVEGDPEQAQQAVWQHIVRRADLPAYWPPQGDALERADRAAAPG